MSSETRNGDRRIRLSYIPMNREDRERMKAFVESVLHPGQIPGEESNEEDKDA